MALSERDLEQVGNYVRARLIDWLPVPVLQLNERIVRVEEELKAQRELMERRFELLERNLDQRFSAVDQRFTEIDKRFEQIDRRFSAQTWFIGVGFVLISTLMSLYTFLA